MTIYRGRSYLDKHRFADRALPDTPPAQLGIVVTIPCHNEAHLLDTLDSLEQCEPPPCEVEVIILVNSHSSHSREIHIRNRQTVEEVQDWKDLAPRKYSYYVLYFPDLPPKHAGVGLARKIAMDEAVDRLEQANNSDGIIVGLDADSLVRENYLMAIFQHFQQNPHTEAASIHFEHPLSGKEYNEKIYEGILQYELFLRYYIEGLRYARYPFAYHTIGSSMAVRSRAYQRQGGMNRRKAGEDFYFLQKFIEQGTLSEIPTTTVIPSPRPSNRVPFGTGKAIQDWLEEETLAYPSYAFRTFEDLAILCSRSPELYVNSEIVDELPLSIQTYFEEENWIQKLTEIRLHVASQQAFTKRFFQTFDGLKVLKFVHFCRDNHYLPIDIPLVAKELGEKIFPEKINENSLYSLLLLYRAHQRRSDYFIPL